MNDNYQFGLTRAFACNYLPEQQEKLLVATDTRLHNEVKYQLLMEQGFRRSGEQIYRPYCENCQACQSIRVLINDFTLSKSQKRLMKKNNAFHIVISPKKQANYYELYKKYINTIHCDGAMYPATTEQFNSFIGTHFTEQVFIEVWDNNILVSVAVTDVLPNALSAVYTFYHPQYRASALGVYSILQQIQLSEKMSKEYLYLGYQIDACQKMNYKNKYHTYQKLNNNQWKTVNK